MMGWLSLWVLTGAVVVYLVLHKSFYHFRVIEKGRCYASGVLTSKFYRYCALKYIGQKYRINTLINLRSVPEREKGNWYIREKAFCRKRGVELIDLPLTTDTPPTPAQIEEFVKIISDLKRIMLIHCEAGAVRTNMMLTVYLKQRFHIPNEEIFKCMDFFGHPIHEHYRGKVKAFILNYQPMQSARSAES